MKSNCYPIKNTIILMILIKIYILRNSKLNILIKIEELKQWYQNLQPNYNLKI